MRRHLVVSLLLASLLAGCGDGGPVEPEPEPGTFRAELTGFFEGDFGGDASVAFGMVESENGVWEAMIVSLSGDLPEGSEALMSVFFVVPSRFEPPPPGSFALESAHSPGDSVPEPGDLVAWLSQPSDTSEAFPVTHVAFGGQAELTESSSTTARSRFSLSFEPVRPDEGGAFTAEGEFWAVP